jgi:microcystin-dependent protein
MPSFTANYNLIKPNVNDPVDEDLWGGYLNDDLDDIDALIKTATDTATAAGVPIGSIVDYAGTTAPSGFLFCFGQAVSRTVTYAALFAAIGTTYGTGDGATTFNLPDFRGRVGAGQDDMGGTSANRLTGLSGGVDGDVLGATGGAESHALTTAQLAAHQHFVAYDVNSVSPTTLNATNYMSKIGDYSGPSNYSLGGQSLQSNVGLTSNTGSGDAHNNVQPTIIVNKIIRFA